MLYKNKNFRRFEPQGRHLKKFHYDYLTKKKKKKKECCKSGLAVALFVFLDARSVMRISLVATNLVIL